MNRLNKLFHQKHENILSIYFTAGYPKLDDTVQILQSLENAGVDFVEVGMPFSDPVADGPTIQQASLQALQNGMSVKVLLEQLKDIRKQIELPLILMGYLNPVLQYGIEQFCKDCAKAGIDGVILPDLPLNEYESKYKSIFEQYGIHLILLISPQTKDDRLKQIDQASSSFIYMVSSSSTTGAKQSEDEFQQAYFERINKFKLKSERIVGFGISNKETFNKACQYANGAIIGSAFVDYLEKQGVSEDGIKDFVSSIRS